MTNIGLKFCPCCGGPAEVTRYNPYDGYQGSWTAYYIECAECGLRTSDFRSLEEASEVWNARVAERIGGDIYLNPAFGDMWIVDGSEFVKINDGLRIDLNEPYGFIKVGHVDGVVNKERGDIFEDNPHVDDQNP